MSQPLPVASQRVTALDKGIDKSSDLQISATARGLQATLLAATALPPCITARPARRPEKIVSAIDSPLKLLSEQMPTAVRPAAYSPVMIDPSGRVTLPVFSSTVSPPYGMQPEKPQRFFSEKFNA